MKLYRYHLVCGRMGDLTGLFVVSPLGERCLRALIKSGVEVQFGEVLGKHSDVSSPVKAAHIKRVKATDDEIAIVLRVLGVKAPEVSAPLTGIDPVEQAIENAYGEVEWSAENPGPLFAYWGAK